MVYEVIDDIVGVGYQNLIENGCNTFDWKYVSSLTYKDSDTEHTGFCNLIFDIDDGTRKKEMDILLPLLFEAVYKYHSTDLKEIYRIRAVMWVRNQNETPHVPHRDLEYEHYTMVYYVNNSDGPTKIYEDGCIIDEIEPKKGRAVIFSGDTYHASSTPTESSNRIVLNFNYGI
tara:strand:+ start:279 stop:797 length:519 start_codon:yes stop_codon:yes gene_type:complete